MHRKKPVYDNRALTDKLSLNASQKKLWFVWCSYDFDVERSRVTKKFLWYKLTHTLELGYGKMVVSHYGIACFQCNI